MTAVTAPDNIRSKSIHLTDELMQHLLNLPEDDRALLAHRMWESLDGPPDDPEEVRQAWKIEIARRLESYRAGNSKSYSAAEVLDHIRARLGEEPKP